MILASGSPRRMELLRAAGYRPRVFVPDVDENPKRGERPVALVRRLSLAKARAVAARLSGASVKGRQRVLAADTIVVIGDEILNKPVNRADAVRMIRKLAGRWHEVFSGYAILHLENGREVRAVNKVVRTRVKIRRMGPKDIAQYLAMGESMDKAGAYAAQGAGMALIEEIWGSYTNVVGLPLAQVKADLERG